MKLSTDHPAQGLEMLELYLSIHTRFHGTVLANRNKNSQSMLNRRGSKSCQFYLKDQGRRYATVCCVEGKLPRGDFNNCVVFSSRSAASTVTSQYGSAYRMRRLWKGFGVYRGVAVSTKQAMIWVAPCVRRVRFVIRYFKRKIST